MTRAVNVPTTF